MASSPVVQVRVPVGLLGRVDLARGGVGRSAWVVEAIRLRLDGGVDASVTFPVADPSVVMVERDGLLVEVAALRAELAACSEIKAAVEAPSRSATAKAVRSNRPASQGTPLGVRAPGTAATRALTEAAAKANEITPEERARRKALRDGATVDSSRMRSMKE